MKQGPKTETLHKAETPLTHSDRRIRKTALLPRKVGLFLRFWAEKERLCGRFQSPVGLVWMWRLNTGGCGNPKVRYLKLPGPEEAKMKPPARKPPPQPRIAHSHPKTEREKVSIKKKRHFQTRRVYHPKSLAKRATKDCSSVQRKLKPERISYNCTI